jgi:uncharacterized membrane protein
MATVLVGERPVDVRAVTVFDRVLAIGSVLILVALVAALIRGSAHWDQIGPAVWAHIATIAVALGLTPVMLLQPRGTRQHRRLGYAWCAALALTALISFDIRLTGRGSFSLIHLLSVWTLIQLPIIIVSARRHQHARHRNSVRGMVLGALLIAGFFTFPFGRLLGSWLFG